MSHAVDDAVGAGDVQDLAVAVEQLTEETRILRQSIDELRDDVVWAARQVLATGDAVAPGYLSNRQRDPFVPNAESNGRTELATNNESAGIVHEGIPYCCDAPRLTWHGDSDSPGITCANCGYVVAELGDVVIWRGDDAQALVAPTVPPQVEPQKQASLFN